jgi:IclR family acetate operon transcriptional repressor
MAILMEWGMPRLSPHTITEPADYLKELSVVRAKGYSVDDQEGAVGIYCLAVPIQNRSGKVIGALSVSGPSPQYTDEYKEALISDMQASAAAMQRKL